MNFTLDSDCHLLITSGFYAGFVGTQTPLSTGIFPAQPIQFNNNAIAVSNGLELVTCQYSVDGSAPGSLSCMNGVSTIEYLQTQVPGTAALVINTGAPGSLGLDGTTVQFIGDAVSALNVVLE